MKIFRSDQIREIDAYTIANEPVASIDLMERASGQLFGWISGYYSKEDRFIIFVGPGNNGGDGLALARMLFQKGYSVEIYYVNFKDDTTPDWKHNFLRLEKETSIKLKYLKRSDQFPAILKTDIIIDGIFGSGLTRSVEGFPAEIIKSINSVGATVISIDIPSGLFGEDNTNNNFDSVIRAKFTLCFELPKLAFMFPDNYLYVGRWISLPIQLSIDAIRSLSSQYSLTERVDLVPILKTRNQFDHKGNFGHGLLISGSSGKFGATVLGASAALRSGIGLITCHLPSSGELIIQTAVPEAMVSLDSNADVISRVGSTASYSAVGVGPGMGTDELSQKALLDLLTDCKKPLVIDADALNILSLNKDWLSILPPNTILTPHPKEFERLAGSSENGYLRMIQQIAFSQEYRCIIVLKGSHTSVSTPDGKVYFNNSGNPGMATAGSGDVLTGIVLSLLAQGYRPENAAILGVALHGFAGDIAAAESSFEAIIASDIIKNTGNAFNKIRNT